MLPVPKTVLVVDDDPIARELVSACLGGRDTAEIVQAAGGEEAIAIVETSSVDLIVADLNMPDYDGVELLSALAQHAVGAPVVIVSGAAGPIVRAAVALARARGLDVLGGLGKPIERAPLWALVERVLAA